MGVALDEAPALGAQGAPDVPGEAARAARDARRARRLDAEAMKRVGARCAIPNAAQDTLILRAAYAARL
jgi:hypothetical protein